MNSGFLISAIVFAVFAGNLCFSNEHKNSGCAWIFDKKELEVGILDAIPPRFKEKIDEIQLVESKKDLVKQYSDLNGKQYGHISGNIEFNIIFKSGFEKRAFCTIDFNINSNNSNMTNCRYGPTEGDIFGIYYLTLNISHKESCLQKNHIVEEAAVGERLEWRHGSRELRN